MRLFAAALTLALNPTAGPHINVGTVRTASDASILPSGAAVTTPRMLDRFVRDFRPVTALAAD